MTILYFDYDSKKKSFVLPLCKFFIPIEQCPFLTLPHLLLSNPNRKNLTSNIWRFFLKKFLPLQRY
ncbi:hypothetical protein BpHYR1_039919 [Brachionus plicatilis]|uniref:Uncharacterized protein n=1 Tax=Brachionus plicatilis TaxID=10195 RepID=A0A3M7QCT1_BRAPC|nr:hypothetical protein BpHYR1_039919 [Brachionus plicatilis]